MDNVVLECPAPAPKSADESARDISRPALKASDLGTAFADVARAYPDRIAFETKSGTYSYGWVLSAARTVASYLRARPGYEAGARVALRLPNSPEYAAAFYGILLADCVAVPLPVQLERFRWQQIVEQCSPDVAILGKGQIEPGDPSPVVLELSGNAADIVLQAPARSGNALAVLLFTSGSTGLPKGVMLSHRNLLANADSILHDLPIRADDKALVLIPFCHSFGNSILQTHMLAGASIAMGGNLMFPASIGEAIAQFGATSFSGVPEVYGMLLKYGKLGDTPLPSLRYMAVAGGQLRPDLAAEVAGRIAPATFHVMYGQSEASPRLASLPPDQLAPRRGSIGKPLPGVTLAIKDDSGRDLPPGEIGMLCARGDNIMLGYWRDEATTAEVLSKDGWLRTGDMAHCDADGYFYIDGRANLLVKVQGHRVHPAEIEGAVEARFPNARAVALPMIRGDETRFALFLASEDARALDIAEIRAACQRDLPSHKVPVHFEILDRLPLNSAYKVDRAALKLRLPPAG